jgi:hypothetical protein
MLTDQHPYLTDQLRDNNNSGFYLWPDLAGEVSQHFRPVTRRGQPGAVRGLHHGLLGASTRAY